MLLIFDLDGTLVDSREDIQTAVNLTRSHYGMPPLPLDTVSGFVGDGTRKLIERALNGSNVDIDEAVRLNMKFYMQHLHDTTHPYPGVMKGLADLRQAGNTLALLSNKPSAACRALLNHLRLGDSFAAVLGGDNAPALKPDPEPIFMIMRMTKCSPATTWMIGDNHTDIEAARRAQVRSAFVRYGFGHTGSNIPTRTFESFDELTSFFLT